jgi:hypothetical protein
VILFPLVDQKVVEPLRRAKLARRQAAFIFVATNPLKLAHECKLNETA